MFLLDWWVNWLAVGTWANIGLATVGITAIAGFIALVSQYAVIQLQKAEGLELQATIARLNLQVAQADERALLLKASVLPRRIGFGGEPSRKLSQFAPVQAAIEYEPVEECATLASDIRNLISMAGWTVVSGTAKPGLLAGVRVGTRAAAVTPRMEHARRASIALVASLNERIPIAMHGGPISSKLPEDMIVITVGKSLDPDLVLSMRETAQRIAEEIERTFQIQIEHAHSPEQRSRLEQSRREMKERLEQPRLTPPSEPANPEQPRPPE